MKSWGEIIASTDNYIMAFKRTAENLWTWKTRFNLKWCVDCYLCCLTSTLRISFCITRWRALWPLMDMFSCCCKVWGSVSSSSFFCSSSCCFCCTTHQASSSELRNLLNAIYTTKQEANKSKIHAKLLRNQGWDKVSQNAGKSQSTWYYAITIWNEWQESVNKCCVSTYFISKMVLSVYNKAACYADKESYHWSPTAKFCNRHYNSVFPPVHIPSKWFLLLRFPN